MITVLGKYSDVLPYIDNPLCNTFAPKAGWTPNQLMKWLDEAMDRGDDFLLVSQEATGVYKYELEYLLSKMGLGTVASGIDYRRLPSGMLPSAANMVPDGQHPKGRCQHSHCC